MARTIQLPDQTRSVIAAQVGMVAASLGVRLSSAVHPELGETFPVWTLTGNAVLSSTPLATAAPTGRWHHQIYRRGNAEAFAYSRPIGPRAVDWQLTGVFESDIAAAIDAAVQVADHSLAGDDEARLLVIPSYGLQCIWVVMSKRMALLPAVVPPGYRATISPLVVYEADDLFARLRAVQHVQGIVP